MFRGTGDARLIALDAGTGKVLWKDVIGAPRLGESASAAPLAWAGVVYMGIGGSELGARGRPGSRLAAPGEQAQYRQPVRPRREKACAIKIPSMT